MRSLYWCSRVSRKKIILVNVSETRVEDLNRDFSPEVSACFRDKLSREAKDYETKYNMTVCMGSWYDEAYAEIFQITRRNDLKEFAFPCTQKPDELHPRPQPLMQCLFDHDPVMQDKFCGIKP